MADSKISALTALTGANVQQTADSLAIVDNSVTTTKKILVSELAQALEVHGTEQASTSGTSIDFTSIPAWVKRITIMFVGVSTNGTSNVIVQLGDSGGVEATGYLCSTSRITTVVSSENSTTGFAISITNSAASTRHGTVTLTMEDSSDFTWVATGVIGHSDTAHTNYMAGSKALSAALDRVRITTVNGTDTFDAGAVNILYE